MKGRSRIVKEAVLKCAKESLIRWVTDDMDLCMTHYYCYYFMPLYGEYLRVAFKILNDKDAIVTSAYPVPQIPDEGVVPYESSN